MNHRDCGGVFESWTIREHYYCFIRCAKCGHYLGGEQIERKVKRLMGIKVNPTLRRL